MKKEDFKVGVEFKIGSTIAKVTDTPSHANHIWIVDLLNRRVEMMLSFEGRSVVLIKYFGSERLVSKKIPLSSLSIVTPKENVEAIKA